VAQADLLAVIAAGDHDHLAAYLRARARWWRTLRVLERNLLVAVAVVGPHRQSWPWITARLTPAGYRQLAHHAIYPPVPDQEHPS
jgi:hypothetical protein